MSPKFGTSGLRGFVRDLTDDVVADHIRAFVSVCPMGGAVHVGWDLRPSSPRIGEAVIAAVRGAGQVAVCHGPLPTPALAMAAMTAGNAAVMVTGSHIPADRNGLKFYVPSGEISKVDEAAVLAALGMAKSASEKVEGLLRHDSTALDTYAARYTAFFGKRALAGLRLGIYEHSSVARDVLSSVLRGLGAHTVALGRSENFIPVDTEAIHPEVLAQLAVWAAEHRLDAILSTDGDGDRPLLAAADGTIIPGDLLGPLTAAYVGAEILVTPVSANSVVDLMPEFVQVVRTRIGSPFVIAGMTALLAADPAARVVGYEPNGGFLLGFSVRGISSPLPPLITRDSLLPLLAPLAAVRVVGSGLASLVAKLPRRFTATDRLQGVEPEASVAFLSMLVNSADRRAAFFDTQPMETKIDLTDGMRLTYADGSVIHLRPSGNAPEFRCYVEAESPERAKALLALHLTKLTHIFI